MENGIRHSMKHFDQENSRLQALVTRLLGRIHDNQQIDERYKAFEFSLLNSKSLKELLHALIVESQQYFQLTDVGLILVDWDFSLSELLEKLDVGLFKNRLQLRNTDDFAKSIYPGKYEVTLGELDALTAGRIFPNLRQVGSSALMPLVRNSRLIGSLHFASDRNDRFSTDKSVDFMHRLASICAVCLENSIAHENLRYQSRFDALTQVSNRMHFDAEFAVELERALRAGSPLTCVFFDMDLFKSINDEYGHAAGDACLKQVAKAIQAELRKTDTLARYGGEEFVALLSCCDRTKGEVTAERIRQAVEKLTLSQNPGLKLTVSIGLSCWQPVAAQSVDLVRLGERLLKCADEALYEAKHGGRNRVVVKAFYQVLEGG